MFQDGFPKYLRNEVSKAVNHIPLKTYSYVNRGTTEQSIEYIQESNLIRFPYRIYYTNVSDEVFSELSIEQEVVLHCIYTRSCDGYVRQKHLKSLLLMAYPDWAIPYIVKLCDEYVIEMPTDLRRLKGG